MKLTFLPGQHFIQIWSPVRNTYSTLSLPFPKWDRYVKHAWPVICSVTCFYCYGLIILVNISNWRVACSEWNNSRNIKKWNHFNANIVSVEKVLRDVVRQSHANVLPLGGISTDKGQSVIMKNLPNLVQCRRYSRALVTMSRSILFRSCRDSDP